MSRRKSTRNSRVGRPRGFDRSQAVERALRLFWANGYEGTSLADLTKALGIVPPSLYAAFGSKEGLFKEAIKLYGARYGLDLAAMADTDHSARVALERLLQEAARAFSRQNMPRGCFIASGMLNCGTDVEALSDFVAAKRSAMVQMIERCVVRGVEAGELDRSTDVAALAQFFGAVIEGMSVQARDGARRKDLEKIVEHALRAWPQPSRGL
jgi:AcrR family transcriptional regulator